MKYLTATILLLFVGIMTISTASAEPSSSDWVVDASTAVDMLEDATLLDTRGAAAFGFGHVEGSKRISWKDFSPSKKALRGELISPSKAAQKLRKLGVSNEKPVLVFGDPEDGWGEDGRIVWMLRTLGHQATYLVDGGYEAMADAGAKTSLGFGSSVAKGDFKAQKTSRYVAKAADLKKKSHLIDTREAREYRGETPYGESRGGHVPGARHIYYKELMGDDGRLKSAHQIRARLKNAGIEKDDEVIVYCTGGVRSAWFAVVLQHLGYANAKNYAGSMWEWSSLDPTSYPLETDTAK